MILTSVMDVTFQAESILGTIPIPFKISLKTTTLQSKTAALSRSSLQKDVWNYPMPCAILSLLNVFPFNDYIKFINFVTLFSCSGIQIFYRERSSKWQ